jgi:fatty acid-binding protein DegV
MIMLEHTDNLDWVEQVRTRLESTLQEPADFHLCPLSSTSSVHMGPGTWGVAVTRI